MMTNSLFLLVKLCLVNMILEPKEIVKPMVIVFLLLKNVSHLKWFFIQDGIHNNFQKEMTLPS